MTVDDEKLNSAEVAALYLAHANELRRFLVGVLRDPQLANDVLQMAFAKLLERGHETRQESRKAWLFRVAYRDALAIRRRESVGDRVFERAVWLREHTAAGAEQVVLRMEAIERVKLAITQLPEEQAQVVRMRIYEDKTFAVISEELGIPLGTALGRMRVALQKLRRYLNDE